MPVISMWRRACGSIALFLVVILAGCQTSTKVTTTPTTAINNAPIDSKGCGNSSPATIGATTTMNLSSGGLSRTYRLHIPAGYQVDHQTPLVLVFHGHGSNATDQESYSQFSVLADQQGFVAAYPQGTIGPDSKTGWATYGRTDPTIDDVHFVSDLLDTLQGGLCIDPQRIFADGISNGGGMTNLLACTLSGRIAAFAPVAGAFYTSIPGGCQPGKAVPVLEFHGTSDPIVSYDGRPFYKLPPITDWLQEWATRNGCGANPSTIFQQDDVTAEQWPDCAQGSTLIHYRITGGGHTWPGAINVPVLGATTHTIDATAIMWDFFQQHPLPSA